MPSSKGLTQGKDIATNFKQTKWSTRTEDQFKIRISLHKREDPSQNRRTLEGETKNSLNVYLSSAKRMPSGNPLSVFSTSSVTCLVCPPSPAMNLKTWAVKDKRQFSAFLLAQTKSTEFFCNFSSIWNCKGQFYCCH